MFTGRRPRAFQFSVGTAILGQAYDSVQDFTGEEMFRRR